MRKRCPNLVNTSWYAGKNRFGLKRIYEPPTYLSKPYIFGSLGTGNYHLITSKKTGWHSNVRSELLSRILGFSASVALLLPEFSFITYGKMTGTSCTSSWFAWFGMDLPTKNIKKLMCQIQHVLIQRWALGSPKICLKNSHVMCQKKGTPLHFWKCITPMSCVC